MDRVKCVYWVFSEPPTDRSVARIKAQAERYGYTDVAYVVEDGIGRVEGMREHPEEGPEEVPEDGGFWPWEEEMGLVPPEASLG